MLVALASFAAFVQTGAEVSPAETKIVVAVPALVGAYILVARVYEALLTVTNP